MMESDGFQEQRIDSTRNAALGASEPILKMPTSDRPNLQGIAILDTKNVFGYEYLRGYLLITIIPLALEEIHCFE